MSQSQVAKIYPTPEHCEQAFYDAFSHCDVAAMMDIWDASFPLTCIHPGSPCINDREQIEQSWQQIFEMSQNIDFSRSDAKVVTEGILSVHTLREDILMHDEPINTMLITNIYRFDGESWRLIVHHVSNEPDFATFDDDMDELLTLDADAANPPPTIH